MLWIKLPSQARFYTVNLLREHSGRDDATDPTVANVR